jgi:hypothetical protein
MWIKESDFEPIGESAWSPSITENPALQQHIELWLSGVDIE